MKNKKRYILSDSYNDTGVMSIKVVAETVKELKTKVADYVMLDESAQPQYFETAIINLDTNEVIRTSYIDLKDGEDS